MIQIQRLARPYACMNSFEYTGWMNGWIIVGFGWILSIKIPPVEFVNSKWKLKMGIKMSHLTWPMNVINAHGWHWGWRRSESKYACWTCLLNAKISRSHTVCKYDTWWRPNEDIKGCYKPKIEQIDTYFHHHKIALSQPTMLIFPFLILKASIIMMSP